MLAPGGAIGIRDVNLANNGTGIGAESGTRAPAGLARCSGAPEPGATPFYLQDDPEDRWTPPDLTRPATAFETTPQDPPRCTRPKPQLAEPWTGGPRPQRDTGGMDAPGL